VTTQTRSTRLSRRHYSPSASVRIGDMPFLMPIIVITTFMVGVSMMGSLWAISEARKAEREARILKINVDGYEKALAFHGIDASKHLPGENP
jgi:hypothetical protein